MSARKIKRSLYFTWWQIYAKGVLTHHGAKQYRRWNQ